MESWESEPEDVQKLIRDRVDEEYEQAQQRYDDLLAETAGEGDVAQ